jgi:hypothetical protein
MSASLAWQGKFTNDLPPRTTDASCCGRVSSRHSVSACSANALTEESDHNRKSRVERLGKQGRAPRCRHLSWFPCAWCEGTERERRKIEALCVVPRARRGLVAWSARAVASDSSITRRRPSSGEAVEACTNSSRPRDRFRGDPCANSAKLTTHTRTLFGEHMTAELLPNTNQHELKEVRSVGVRQRQDIGARSIRHAETEERKDRCP